MADHGARTWPGLDLDLRAGSAPPDLEDRLALAFDEAQATAVEQAGETHWRVFFDDRDQRDTAEPHLRRVLGEWFDVAAVEVEDEGWALKVQQDLGRVEAGPFTISPPWDLPPTGDVTPGQHLIVIEPSTGFGTGHHQSTRLCLRALARAVSSGMAVIDAGTGSGVLAIAAARLGARRVIAVDHDPDAIASARSNVALNAVGHVVECEVADLTSWQTAPADVVVANLTVLLLRRFAATLSALVRPGGTLITGGFTTDQTALVTDAFLGFGLTDRTDEDDWASLTLTKRR